ncbi:MAG: GGDEF domain-containing protein [Actinobacteria bacterium]|nr:GGDEF domain-containing protein [Actinomycetota bacterium]
MSDREDPRDEAGRDDQYAGTGFFDDLTWLPSRLLFRDRAERAIAWADRHGTRMAVLFIEVDDFEEVSRNLGSDAADSILRDVGNRLVAAIRREDSVARTRIAEYAVLLAEVDSVSGLGVVGQKLLQIFERPFEAAEGETQVTASVGAAVYPDHALTIEGLLVAADAALQHAQADSAGEIVVYTNGLSRRRSREGEPPERA